MRSSAETAKRVTRCEELVERRGGGIRNRTSRPFSTRARDDPGSLRRHALTDAARSCHRSRDSRTPRASAVPRRTGSPTRCSTSSTRAGDREHSCGVDPDDRSRRGVVGRAARAPPPSRPTRQRRATRPARRSRPFRHLRVALCPRARSRSNRCRTTRDRARHRRAHRRRAAPHAARRLRRSSLDWTLTRLPASASPPSASATATPCS